MNFVKRSGRSALRAKRPTLVSLESCTRRREPEERDNSMKAVDATVVLGRCACWCAHSFTIVVTLEKQTTFYKSNNPRSGPLPCHYSFQVTPSWATDDLCARAVGPLLDGGLQKIMVDFPSSKTLSCAPISSQGCRYQAFLSHIHNFIVGRWRVCNLNSGAPYCFSRAASL